MSNPPALDDVDVCGPLVQSITDVEGSFLHQHAYQRQVEQLLLSAGSSGHASAPDTGHALTWSHQEPHFQQEAVLQLQAAADSISASNVTMHSTMAEYLAHMTAAASGGDAYDQGVSRDSAQMQIPMSELMAHMAPGDGEVMAASAAAAGGGEVPVGQMLPPSKQLQYSGPQEHQDNAPSVQLLPEGVQMQMQVASPNHSCLWP